MGNRYYLNCPFKDKDIVLKLGAKWDGSKKLWYFTEKSQAKFFKEWIPSGHMLREPIKKTDLSKLNINDDYVIFSVQDTGIRKTDEIMELSILSLEGEELYHSLFYPKVEVLHPVAELTGLTRKKLEDQKFFFKKWDEIEKILINKKLICYNVQIVKRIFTQTLQVNDLNEEIADEIFRDAVSVIDFIDCILHPKASGLEYVSKELGILTKEEKMLCRATERGYLILKVLQKLAQ